MEKGKVKIKVRLGFEMIIDEDDLKPFKKSSWEDNLTQAKVLGIPVTRRIDVLADKGKE